MKILALSLHYISVTRGVTMTNKLYKKRYIIQKCQTPYETMYWVRDTHNLTEYGVGNIIYRAYYKKDCLAYIESLGV